MARDDPSTGNFMTSVTETAKGRNPADVGLHEIVRLGNGEDGTPGFPKESMQDAKGVHIPLGVNQGIGNEPLQTTPCESDAWPENGSDVVELELVPR